MRLFLLIAALTAAMAADAQEPLPGKLERGDLAREIETLNKQLIATGRDAAATPDECQPNFKWARINQGNDFISYRAQSRSGEELRLEFEAPCDVERVMKAWPCNEALCPAVGAKLGTDLPGRKPACVVKSRKMFEWVIVGG